MSEGFDQVVIKLVNMCAPGPDLVEVVPLRYGCWGVDVAKSCNRSGHRKSPQLRASGSEQRVVMA